jgi:fumarate reductase subunit C
MRKKQPKDLRFSNMKKKLLKDLRFVKFVLYRSIAAVVLSILPVLIVMLCQKSSVDEDKNFWTTFIIFTTLFYVGLYLQDAWLYDDDETQKN